MTCRRCLTCPCFSSTYFPLVLQETALTKATLQVCLITTMHCYCHWWVFRPCPNMCPCSRNACIPPGTEPSLTSPEGWVPTPFLREPWAGWLSPLSCCRYIHSSEEPRGWQSSLLPPHPLRCLFCAGNRGNCHPHALVS